MSKYDDVVLLFLGGHEKSLAFFVFFCGPFKQFGLLNFKGKKRIRDKTPFLREY